MKRLTVTIISLIAVLTLHAREFVVHGPQGGLAMTITLPEGCDFGGHWKSEGKMQRMTIENEISDAIAMWEDACLNGKMLGAEFDQRPHIINERGFVDRIILIHLSGFSVTS